MSAEQLAALVPGATVSIEISGDFRRPKYVAGTVVRLAGSHIVVSVKSPRGVTYVQQYGRRDGIRDGRNLVRARASQRRQPVLRDGGGPARRIDALYRDWSRNRSDLDRLVACASPSASAWRMKTRLRHESTHRRTCRAERGLTADITPR